MPKTLVVSPQKLSQKCNLFLTNSGTLSSDRVLHVRLDRIVFKKSKKTFKYSKIELPKSLTCFLQKIGRGRLSREILQDQFPD